MARQTKAFDPLTSIINAPKSIVAKYMRKSLSSLLIPEPPRLVGLSIVLDSGIHTKQVDGPYRITRHFLLCFCTCIVACANHLLYLRRSSRFPLALLGFILQHLNLGLEVMILFGQLHTLLFDLVSSLLVSLTL
jgi:hypothetical protein